MDESNKVSKGLTLSLQILEDEIKQLIKDNPVSLDFNKKSWAACPEGQRLLELTKIANNLRDVITKLKENDL